MRPRVFATPSLSLAAALTLMAAVLGACGRKAPPPPPAAEVAQPVDATLQKIKERKRLRCGVSEGVPGFSERGLTGWRGFDIDICRAVAAAVLGDSRAVSITGLSSRTRYAALQSGTVDLLPGGSSFTFTHDVSLGLTYAGVSYYDSQGFLTSAPRTPPPPRPRRGATPSPPLEKTVAALNGARICVQGGSPAQQVLAESFRARGMAYRPVVKEDRQQALQAYQRGECDAVSDDLAMLAIDLSSLSNPERHVILNETLADEPLGPVVRHGDERWADVVRWTLNAMILAEQSKLNSRDVEDARQNSVEPQVRRLLGLEGDAGRRLGLADDWAFKVIRQVGAYDEVFERHLGLNTPLKMERSRNALWNADKPGQLYAPPLR